MFKYIVPLVNFGNRDLVSDLGQVFQLKAGEYGKRGARL